MERLPGLEFADRALSVRYSGSLQPQTLDIWAKAKLPVGLPRGPIVIPMLCYAIAMGGAGGAEFPPSAGRARVISGPMGSSPDAQSGSYHWQLEVAGVSPYFMRNIVECLRIPYDGWELTELKIAGSAPFAGSALSIEDSRFATWLVDSDAYLQAWPEVPFPIIEHDMMRGASLRIRLAGPVNHDAMLAFEQLLLFWRQATSGYVNDSEDDTGLVDPVPRISRSQIELAAGWDGSDFASQPVKRMLVNMLIWFHEQVAPIEFLRIAFQD